MERREVRKKHYEKLLADDSTSMPAGPSFSRGWIRFRQPWRYPFEVMRFLRMWLRLKRELDRSPGLIAFEYRVRLQPLMLGMHVVWQSHADEMRFYRESSHRAISNWSMKSLLTPALRLEHFVRLEASRRVRLGGFYVYENEGDLPEEIH
jgi:hypothetical protein